MTEMPGFKGALGTAVFASLLLLLLALLWGGALIAIATLLKEGLGIDVFARLRRGKK